MPMTQSQVRFKNEVNDLAYQAIIKLQQCRGKVKRKKQIRPRLITKIKFALLIGTIMIATYNLIPWNQSSGNVIYKQDFQTQLGRELAAISSIKSTRKQVVTVMFLFNKNNVRYTPLEKALVKELKEKHLIVRTMWPLDGRDVEEDEFPRLLDNAITESNPAGVLMLISPGGIDYATKADALLKFAESGKKLIIFGNCALDSNIISMTKSGNCLLISRRQGWLKNNNAKDYPIKNFVSDNYVLIGNI